MIDLRGGATRLPAGASAPQRVRRPRRASGPLVLLGCVSGVGRADLVPVPE
jgi:hypothetical protein